MGVSVLRGYAPTNTDGKEDSIPWYLIHVE
jgi:hypothetical protein